MFFFFFSSRRRHTRSLCDWSSDVCSSDLALWLLRERGADSAQATRFLELAERAVKRLEERVKDVRAIDQKIVELPPGRSEERRVGKECRSRGSQVNENKEDKQEESERERY